MRNRPLYIILALSLIANIVLFAIILSDRSSDQDARVEQPPAVTDRPEVGTEVAVATATATATPEPTATTLPTPTPTMEPTPSPTPEPSPTPTPTEPPATPTPAASPTPQPTSTPDWTQIGPDWLIFLNQIRFEAGLPPVDENTAWSASAESHALYMSKTGSASHNQDPGSPFYTRNGSTAAANSNLAVNFLSVAQGHEWAFNYWVSAPFHAVPMLDPELQAVGFGIYREANAPIEVGAALDVKSGLQEGTAPADIFPVLFPKDGGETWVLSYSLPEFPDGRTHCGYGTRAGAPIIVQLGSGDVTPEVQTVSVKVNGNEVVSCYFDETSYTGASNSVTNAGRNILDQRDAIIILPGNPIPFGATVEVTVVANGQTINWQFSTVQSPPVPGS